MSDDKRAIQIKSQIWILMHDAEMYHHYFYALADKQRRYSRLLNAMLLLLSLGAASTLLAGALATDLVSAFVSFVSSTILFFSIAGLTIAEIIFQFSRNVGVAESASWQARDIASETRKLQRKLNVTHSVDDLTARADILQGLLNGVTRVDVPDDDEFLAQAGDEAEEQLISEFPEGRPATDLKHDSSCKSTDAES